MTISLVYSSFAGRVRTEMAPLLLPLAEAADGRYAVVLMAMQGPAPLACAAPAGFQTWWSHSDAAGSEVLAFVLAARRLTGNDASLIAGPEAASRPDVRAAGVLAVLDGLRSDLPLWQVGAVATGTDGAAVAPQLTLSGSAVLLAAAVQAAPAWAAVDVGVTPLMIDSWGGAAAPLPAPLPGVALRVEAAAAGATGTRAIPIPRAGTDPWFARMLSLYGAA